MKNKKANLLILLVAIILVLYFTLKDNFSDVVEKLKEANILIFILAILIFLISLFFKAASFKNFINEYHCKYSFKNSYLLTLIGQFLNGITPFSSGGQPFQVYLLKKQGVRITDSTNVMIKDFIAFQMALIIMGIFAILFNFKFNIISNESALSWLIFVGFGINIIVLLFLFFLSCAKKTGKKLVNSFLNFLFKFKFMVKFKEKKEKLLLSLDHFYETSATIKNGKLRLFNGIIYNLIHLVLLYLIPMIIFMALGDYNVTPLESVVATSFVMLIGNFIPIPGATGGIEYSFIKFFGCFSSGALLSGAMLLWRFVTYFLPMVIGAVVLVFKREVKQK